MAVMNIVSHSKEACDVWKDLTSKSADGKVLCDDLRAALKKKGIRCLNLDGTEKNDKAIRLAVNKYLGVFRKFGIANGKFADKAEAQAFTKARFGSIVSTPEMPEFDDVFDDWD